MGRSGSNQDSAPSLWAHRMLWVNMCIQLANATAVWIHVVSVQWVLTVRGESAVVISLAPAALAVPFLLVALPVGVVAGFASRKKLMAGATLVSSVATAAVAVMVGLGGDNAALLVLSVLVVGLSYVVVIVSWQSLLPETVDRRIIPAAALLDGAFFNMARAVGPLIAGAVLGLAGAAWAFAVVAVFSAACTLSLWVGERRHPDRTRPRRPVWPELAEAVRYARNSVWTTRLLAQVVLFGIPSSALWALISIAAHDRLGMESGGFGSVMAIIGLGAVVAGVGLGGLRSRLRVKTFAAVGSAVYAAALIVLATSTSFLVVGIAMFCVGAAWVSVQSTWMSMGHQTFPEWLRPRLIALLLLWLQGSQAVGSLVWGVVSDVVGLEAALSVAAALLVVSAAALVVVGLGPDAGTSPVLANRADGAEADWGTRLDLAGGLVGGPVEVRYEYGVAAEAEGEFLAQMRILRRSRLRLGGRQWALTRSDSVPGLFVESYLVQGADAFGEQERERLTVPETRFRERVEAVAHTVSGPVLVPVAPGGGHRLAGWMTRAGRR